MKLVSGRPKPTRFQEINEIDTDLFNVSLEIIESFVRCEILNGP